MIWVFMGDLPEEEHYLNLLDSRQNQRDLADSQRWKYVPVSIVLFCMFCDPNDSPHRINTY